VGCGIGLAVTGPCRKILTRSHRSLHNIGGSQADHLRRDRGAADIERRMLVKRMGGGGNAWPTYGFDEEDRKGWVQEDYLKTERWIFSLVHRAASLGDCGS
jgi:hypothetical protein